MPKSDVRRNDAAQEATPASEEASLSEVSIGD